MPASSTPRPGFLVSKHLTYRAATIEVDSGTLIASGTVSGSGSLTKLGSGTLTLSEANTYTGGTIINGGKLMAGSNSALGNGAGTLAVNTGGTLDLNGKILTVAARSAAAVRS